MNCQRVQRFLSLYHDGHSAGRENAAVSAHVRDCPACRQFRELLTAWSSKVRTAGENEPTPRREVRSRALDRWTARREGIPGMPSRWRPPSLPGTAVPPLVWGTVAVALCVAVLTLGRWEQGPDKSTPREMVAPGHNPRQTASKSPKLGVTPPPLVAVTDAAKAATAGPPAEPGVDSGQIPLKRDDRVPARRASLLRVPTKWVMGSSRVDGGFSPRLGPRTASAPAPNSPPSLPDDQYLDGRDPSLLARWNTLGGPEKQQLQEVLCKLRRPADDFVRIPFPLIATAGSGAAAVAAAAREYDREAKVVDPRLFRKVTLQDKGIALSDLCAELQSQTGVQFRASRSVADEKATVFVKEERARDVMRAISHLFGYPWVRSSRDGEYRYELDQDLRSQLAEEELRNRDRDAALLALDGEMQKYRSYLEMSVEELQRRVHQAGEQRDQKVSSLLVPMALNGGWGGVQLYHRLTPRERSDLADGREIVLRSDAPNPDRRLPAAWNRPILESWNGGTEDGGSRVNQVRLKLNRSELGQVSLISTISVVSPGTRSYTDEEIATGRNPSAANPDNSIANQPLRGQSPFDQIVSIIPNPSSPADKNYRRMEMDLDLDLVFFNFDLSKPHAVSADAWEAVHRATGLPIVADFYTRLYPASKLTVDRKPLFDALCSLGDTLGARWRKDGGFLLCRSTSYFWDKLKEVPNRHLQRWSRDRDANGGLPFSDLLEMAAMPDQQLDPTSVAEGIEHYWKLPEWGLITSPYYRHRARFLSTLAPDQLQRSFKEEGIPFAELTPAQQRGAMQMQREALGEVEREGGGPTQIPPELWTHAFVTVKYIPAGWYAWIPPRAVRNGLWRGPSGPFGGRAAQEALAQARRFYPPASPQDVQFSRGGYLRVSLWLQR